MSTPSIVFFGTHEFAATILEGLIQSHLVTVSLVITQPDRPVGRKQELQASPVKLLAQQYKLPLDQPPTLKSYNLEPNTYHLGIVAQYGLLIPEPILTAFPHGIVNVHTSLLPKYRGASPIQSALMNGDTMTGVTIMKMDVGLDTGPIILQKSLTIDADDTYATLDKKLAVIGVSALEEALPSYLDGTRIPVPQNSADATVCRELDRDHGRINWSKTNKEIYNLYRGLTPWPGIWTTWNGKRLKFLRVAPSDRSLAPGQVMLQNGTITIGCGTGSLDVLDLQLEGKSPMSATVFANGYKDIDHATLV